MIKLIDGAMRAYNRAPDDAPQRVAIAAVVQFVIAHKAEDLGLVERAETPADRGLRLESMRLAVQWTERHESVGQSTLVQTAGRIEDYLRNGVTA